MALPLAYCRSCNAPIVWAINDRTRRRAPLDANLTPDGNCALDPVSGEYHVYGRGAVIPANDLGRLHTNHFQTCPNAADHARGPAR